jgi:hypothetical protein
MKIFVWKLGMAVHACDPSIKEAEAGRLKKFKVSLGCMVRPSLLKNIGSYVICTRYKILSKSSGCNKTVPVYPCSTTLWQCGLR